MVQFQNLAEVINPKKTLTLYKKDSFDFFSIVIHSFQCVSVQPPTIAYFVGVKENSRTVRQCVFGVF